VHTEFWWILLAIVVYGVIRSWLASWRTRKLAKRLLGEKIYRAYRLFLTIFTIVGGLVLIYMVDTLPDVMIYSFGMPWVLVTIPVQVLCFAGGLASLRQTDIWDLTGIRRLFRPEVEREQALVISGMYYWVRHPLYLCVLLFVWLMPVNTWNILAFNVGITILITIGVMREEKRLLKKFGEDYAEYQKRVPMLFPGFWLKRPEK
jgi:methanethiol S-methyltransferase